MARVMSNIWQGLKNVLIVIWAFLSNFFTSVVTYVGEKIYRFRKYINRKITGWYTYYLLKKKGRLD